MQKLSLALSLMLSLSSAYAGPLPQKWKLLLRENSDCRIRASLLELESTPFAMLQMIVPTAPHVRNVPLVRQTINKNFVKYTTVDPQLGIPSVTVTMPNPMMSSLPQMEVAFSGVKYDCFMFHVPPATKDTVLNVGSLGH